MNTLLLFDIDGTLLQNSLASRLAYIAAIKDRFGLDLNLEQAVLCGKTDIQNLGEALNASGMDAGLGNDPVLLEKYLDHLAALLPTYPAELLPGVTELLSQISRMNEYRSALGTGNIEAGARIKLAPFDLNRYFATGGFAEDGSNRAGIIAAGITKAKSIFNTDFSKVVVIGDTPLDIECAKANNLHCLAVATGNYDESNLTAAGATKVIKDLTQPEAFWAAVKAMPADYRG